MRSEVKVFGERNVIFCCLPIEKNKKDGHSFKTVTAFL
jgi:hypothetical protein